MDDAIALVAGDTRVEIAPRAGGALAAFAYRDVNVLRPTPAAALATGDVRAHACYPLVPYSNRIANARLSYDGHDHPLARNFGDHPHAIHGVGWQRPWRVVARDATRALLALTHDAAGDAARAWPWPFRATQAMSLRASASRATLTMKLTLANGGDTAFPFGLGWHPFFPVTPRSRLGFRADAVWQTDATRLPTARVPIPDAWRFDPPRASAATALDNAYAGWDGEATLVDAARRIAVTLRADRAAGFLVVYAPDGRDFVAVEPVTHMTDAFNRAARGEPGTGTRILGPGRAFSCTIELVVRPLP